MYNHQDLEFFYLGSEENWTMERITHHGMGSRDNSTQSGVRASSLRTKGKVLILEDFDSIRALLSEHFKRQGFEVDSSATLGGALVLSREDTPNVLFIDYDLTGENPYTAIQQLHTALPNTTIVLIGGPLSATDQDRALRAGATRIMEKGYDLSNMDQIANTALPSYQIANA